MYVLYMKRDVVSYILTLSFAKARSTKRAEHDPEVKTYAIASYVIIPVYTDKNEILAEDMCDQSRSIFVHNVIQKKKIIIKRLSRITLP